MNFNLILILFFFFFNIQSTILMIKFFVLMRNIELRFPGGLKKRKNFLLFFSLGIQITQDISH